MPLSERFGQLITSQRTLDRQGRITSIDTTAAQPGGVMPASLQHLTYDYGNGGLIKTRNNAYSSAGSFAESFDYDFLGRLSRWSVQQGGQISTQGYEYDDVGNLLSMNVEAGAGRTVQYKYGPAPNSALAGPYAIREMDENGATSVFQYDGAGRQIGGEGKSIIWHPSNLPSQIQKPLSSLEANFQYDADGLQTVRAENNKTIVYTGGYERRALTDGKVHVFNLVAPNRVLGQVVWREFNGSLSPADVNFFHTDLLGSPETVSDSASGTVVEKMAYEPFGQRRDPTTLATPVTAKNPRSIGFTGHRPDEQFGLIDMGGRLYDPATTRFITPDPYSQTPTSARAANRYAYVYNDPVNYVDPTGFQAEGADFGIYTYMGGGGSIFDWLGLGAWSFEFGFGGWGGGAPTGNWGQKPIYAQQQSPTKADSTRQAADAGPGWNAVQAKCDTCSLLNPPPSYRQIELGYKTVGEIWDWTPDKEAQQFFMEYLNYIPTQLSDANIEYRENLRLEINADMMVGRAMMGLTTPSFSGMTPSILGGAQRSVYLSTVKFTPGRIPRGNVSAFAAMYEEVAKLHTMLDPIAIGRRTTSVVRALRGDGTIVDVFASGAEKDLTPLQRGSLIDPAQVAAIYPGLHAEMTALDRIQREGWTPIMGISYGRAACPICADTIERAGGRFTTTASLSSRIGEARLVLCRQDRCYLCGVRSPFRADALER